MTAPWQKVFRDFWRERTRTLLVVLAIALGIAGFTAVLASYAVLTRALNDGYLGTNPASATIQIVGSVDDALVQAILANRAVTDAEQRRTVSGRIKVGPAEWRNLRLFVFDDYGRIRVSTIARQEGAWPPGPGELLIERDALRVAKAKIGATVTVRTADGEEMPLRVTGTVHDVGQAQARMENVVYGYITRETLAALGEEPYLDELKLLVAQDRYNEKHIRAVASEVQRAIEARGVTVQRVDVPPPGKHPHAALMGMLMLAMAGFGLLVLLLSGVLVANLLTALMASQVRQIGVMKAIGGTRGQIASIYLGQAALLGAAAIVVALPLGLYGSRLLCRYQAGFLNFDIASFAVPLWVYALTVAVGLIVPVVAAAYPVWKGSGVPVRVALAEHGVSRSAFGASAIDRLLAGWSGAARPLVLALRNSFRRRARLALTVLTLAVAGVFFMAAFNVRASLIHTLDRWFGRVKSDVSVTLRERYAEADLARVMAKVPGVRAYEAWVTTGGSRGDDGFSVVALPPATRLLDLEIVLGRRLCADDANAVVVNTALAAKGLRVGQTVRLQIDDRTAPWQVVGIAREPFSPPVAYVSKGSFTGSNHLRLVLARNDRASIDAVKAALDRSLEEDGIRAVGSTSKNDSRYGFDQHMLMIYVFLLIMAGLIGGVGALGLMTTMSLNVLERRREMGVLRAIGATAGAVWRIVVVE
ncbi:MAG: putative transport system permease protein, partial [Acidobacteriota bacterium]|nr:putative transport system permease protein [Acidobacteriota bacterium]